MKSVVIRGCFLCSSVLYRRRRRRHPSLALTPFFFPWERRVAPRLASSLTSRQQPPKDTRPNNGRKYLWEKKKKVFVAH